MELPNVAVVRIDAHPRLDDKARPEKILGSISLLRNLVERLGFALGNELLIVKRRRCLARRLGLGLLLALLGRRPELEPCKVVVIDG
jgi:hypothetical protein